MHIPELSDHRFRFYSTTNSDSLCPLIPLFIRPLFVGDSESVDELIGIRTFFLQVQWDGGNIHHDLLLKSDYNADEFEKQI